MCNNLNIPNLTSLFNIRPQAVAKMRGGSAYPNIKGNVWFYQTSYGVIVVADIASLPSHNDKCKSPIFAFHIHEGENCSGNATDEFANALTHYNPHNCLHPYHAGDLPPLFSANGYAFSAVLSDRFRVEEVIGKTIIIHSSVDDFTTQPAGNSGKKIACGKIQKYI